MSDEKYILIIGDIPTDENEKDGLIQRELAIDGILSDYKKIYVKKIRSNVSVIAKKILNKILNKMLKQKEKDLNILAEIKNNDNITFKPCITKKELYSYCKSAIAIYCHSLYSLSRLGLKNIDKFKDKIIVDIHGCVVEEEEMKGNRKHLSKYKKIEKFGFNRIRALIAVTDNLKELYKIKYPKITTNFIILPIFKNSEIENFEKNNSKLKIIYSGGVQKWQNIDLMIETINKIVDKFEIQILTPNTKIIKEKLKKYSLENKIEVKSVASNKIQEEYKKADLGFILRDDIVVNQVACPTKIIEYFNYGIIPIVLESNIGDFKKHNYSYISNDDLKNGIIPDKNTIEEMRKNNYRVLAELKAVQNEGAKKLCNLIEIMDSVSNKNSAN